MATERILPLQKEIREALIDVYASDTHKESLKADSANNDCLARVYLGRRKELQPHRVAPAKSFSLRNFNLYVDQMGDLDVDVHRYAEAIGSILAVMHWDANADAEDVEFVLGSAPITADDLYQPITIEQIDALPPGSSTWQQVMDVERRTVHLWLLDFNRVKQISMDEAGVDQAVAAFYRNDPYFPRPSLSKDTQDHATWDVFEKAYPRTARWIHDQKLLCTQMMEWTGLPQLFIDKVVDQEQRRAKLRREAAERSEGFFTSGESEEE